MSNVTCEGLPMRVVSAQFARNPCGCRDATGQTLGHLVP
jgi:hypothetical protein